MDEIETHLQDQFGPDASLTPLSSANRMGRRVHGVDLSTELTAAQAELLVSLLDEFRIISFPGQDQLGSTVADLERVANHFGAPIPHPYNYANYADFVRDRVPLEVHAPEHRVSAKVNAAFPAAIECADGADSPAVYIVTNLVGSGPDAEPEHVGGQHWHTDIEFQPIPLSTSMFFVQSAPTKRTEGDGTWVTNPPREEGFYHPESASELARRREVLPLNGETAYTDTAAAFAALSPERQRELETVMVRRRLRVGDPGWLVPLVYDNPRNGLKSLHSPVWASRGKRIAPAQVEGLSEDESRFFFDELEEHCLSPEFRYDHDHVPGDVTIWSNFATLHTAPPSKRIVNDVEDARLLYRISCKGEPSFCLPRTDADEWIDENIVPPFRSDLAV